MSQDSESFEALRRLLALKRHEQPPPGYFEGFSRQVIARIKAGERGEGSALLERLFWEAPWLERIWRAFEAKPILAGVCGVGACCLLLAGVIYSDRADIPPVALVPVGGAESVPMATLSLSAADHPFTAKPDMLMEASSTSPVGGVPPDGPFLGDITKLRGQAQPVSWSIPAGN